MVPQTILKLPLPLPGQMVNVSPAFTPPQIKGIQFYPDDPLHFNFIVHQGDNKLEGDQLKKESEKLIKYFLASLTVPETDLWVNLSPYEHDRIIPQAFGVTEMGRDLLAQDYILKQITASLVYPEQDLGKKFWDEVYKQAFEKFGVTDIPANTFNKVWIVPDKAEVYESDNTVYVLDSHLKVMLDSDYVAMKANMGEEKFGTDKIVESDVKKMNDISSGVLRDVIVPAIEREVNEGKNFAKLRQIYNSMILATWYKQTLKDGLLGQIYVDKQKVAGVDVADKNVKQKIYDRYMQAFKKGVYDYVKEEYNPETQEIIPRKYFSGGFKTEGLSRDLAIYNLNDPKSIPLEKFQIIETHFASLTDLYIEGVRLEETKNNKEDKKTLVDFWGNYQSKIPGLADVKTEKPLAETTSLTKEQLKEFKQKQFGEPVVMNLNDLKEAGKQSNELTDFSRLSENKKNEIALKVARAFQYQDIRIGGTEDNEEVVTKMIRDEIKKRLGEGVISDEDVSDIANRISYEIVTTNSSSNKHYMAPGLGFVTVELQELKVNGEKADTSRATISEADKMVQWFNTYEVGAYTIESLFILPMLSLGERRESTLELAVKLIEESVSSEEALQIVKAFDDIAPQIVKVRNRSKVARDIMRHNGEPEKVINAVTELINVIRQRAHLDLNRHFKLIVDYFTDVMIAYYRDKDAAEKEKAETSKAVIAITEQAHVYLTALDTMMGSMRRGDLLNALESAIKSGDETKMFDQMVIIFGLFKNNEIKGFAGKLEEPTKNVGGIDLNSAMLNLQIKRDGKGVALPIQFQNLQNIHIEGLFPVIINITPVTTLPLLSGLTQADDKAPQKADNTDPLSSVGPDLSYWKDPYFTEELLVS